MIDPADLFANEDPEFEESIRIDRELEATSPADRRERRYSHYLDRYYLTEASVEFLEELIDHVQNPNPAPDERNHWLYGYYGSGKSHLLTALELLLDTQELAETDLPPVWGRFDDQGSHTELGTAWQDLHEDVVVVPISINLLRYQSVREQSFSEIILQRVYQERGFAERLDVAFFEEEFQREGGLYDTRSVWEQREQLANEILRAEGVKDPHYDWADISQYQILSDIVLEGLMNRVTETNGTLDDILQQNVGQELAVKTLEAYRQDLQAEFERPVKIVLLMDEVTLFIGGDYQRLSELNALAESIGDIGRGNIISVVTAQSNIEDVQPGLATKQLDFGILKDRFPQQYELPSRHVGEIVQQRLLSKSYQGAQWVDEEALTGTVHPKTMLVYRDVTQNTEPPLDAIDETAFVEYYPLLPYQPALFMEILSNLRDELADATKSIFSGTARAVLALVAGLREEWADKDVDRPIISLVDFYDLVRYELQDIIPEKTEVIEDIKADDDTTDFDVRVAKAVLLLSYVPDMVPQSDPNLAAAVMDDLEGQPRANVQTQVQESLEGNLEKYIRPDTSTDGSDLRLTDREEQQLISTAREFEADPDWDSILDALDEHLWESILAELGLPETYEYSEDEDDDGTAYQVGYHFAIDDYELATGGEEEAIFDVDVVVRGLRPDVDDDHIGNETLYWLIETEGLSELQSQLTEWWALIEATRSTNPPESLVRDREDAADRVVEKLTTALGRSSFRVEASEFSSFDATLTDYIDEAYPPYFHPELSRIDDSHLEELRQLEDNADLPEWARSIGVPGQSTGDFATFSDIAFKLRQLIGEEIQDSDGTLDVATVLDRVGERESLFVQETEDGVEPAPATLAVLWGLCRAGVFRPTSIDEEPVPIERVLWPRYHTSLALTPIPFDERPKDVFVEYDIIEPTESGNKGYVTLDGMLEELERQASALAEDVTVQVETTFETAAVEPFLDALAEHAEAIADTATTNQARAKTVNVGDLPDLIETTQANEAALETAERRWTERRAFLLQLEGLVRLCEVDIDWLGADVQTAIADLTDQLAAAHDTEWWTDDGWSAFVSDLNARQTAIDALQDAWESQQATTNLDAVRERLAGHPWLVEPTELPVHGVHEAFQAAYLDSLRGFRNTIQRIARTIEPLTGPEPGQTDESALRQVLGHLDSGVDWSAVTISTVDTRRTQLSTLETVVGDATPDDFAGIGVLHDDADALRSQLNALNIEGESPEIIEIDSGVIVR